MQAVALLFFGSAGVDLKPSSSRTVLPWPPPRRCSTRGSPGDDEFDDEQIYSSPAGVIARHSAERDSRAALPPSVAALRALQGLLLRQDSVTISGPEGILPCWIFPVTHLEMGYRCKPPSLLPRMTRVCSMLIPMPS